MKKTPAVVLALLLTLVVLGTFVSIVTGWFNPVVKVTGNKITFANMEDNIDFCAAPLIYGEKTVEQLGTDLLNMVVETACGKQTKAEALGFVETAIARICNYV